MKKYLAFAIAFALPCSAFAQGDGLVIKIRKPAVGDVTKETKNSTEVMVMKGNAMGQPINQDQKKVQLAEFTDKVIAVEDGAAKPSKVERTYTKAEIGLMGEKKSLANLEGKTVLIEKKGAKYEFSMDGKPLDNESTEFVGQDFSEKKDDDTFGMLLPKEAIKDGGTWKVDLEKVAKVFGEGMGIDLAKSTGTGKLVKSYKKGNATFGELDIKLDLAIKTFGPGANAFNVKPGGVLTITFTMDGCLDGTEETGKAKMTMLGKLDAEVPNVELNILMDFKMDGARESLKKK